MSDITFISIIALIVIGFVTCFIVTLKHLKNLETLIKSENAKEFEELKEAQKSFNMKAINPFNEEELSQEPQQFISLDELDVDTYSKNFK